MKKVFYSIVSIVVMIQLASCSKNDNSSLSQGQSASSVAAGNNTASYPSTPLPKDILNLAPWKLCIPIDASGSNTGSAKIIDSTALKAGYTSSWFYTSSDNGVVFWCPTDGATTTPGSGSDHPRTELSEYRQWALSEKGKLQSTIIVNRHPLDTADIIIGQIHGGGTNGSAPFVMLHLKDGVIEAVIRQSLTAAVYHKQNIVTGISSTTKIYYSIYSNGNSIYFNVITTPQGGTSTTSTWDDPIPAEFNAPGVVVHFAAGAYVQDHTPLDGLFPNSTDGGRVTMYTLTITHY